MTTRPRRLATALAAVAALGASGALAASAMADHTQRLDIGAELVRQQPGGKPWIVNLTLGAEMGMSDGSVPEPINHIVFQFTKGAKVHPEAFGSCTERILRNEGVSGCPHNSRLGEGDATTSVLGEIFPATITVFNGPKVGSGRKLLVNARALGTVQIVLEGTLTKVSGGKYGWRLDLPIAPIRIVGDSYASITKFHVTVGGIGRKKVPFIEAPTVCTKPGWPFFGTFTYADGSTGTSSALITCLLKATNN
jgi:hypothetical protein